MFAPGGDAIVNVIAFDTVPLFGDGNVRGTGSKQAGRH
jgi:hypothetical protein